MQVKLQAIGLYDASSKQESQNNQQEGYLEN